MDLKHITISSELAKRLKLDREAKSFTICIEENYRYISELENKVKSLIQQNTELNHVIETDLKTIIKNQDDATLKINKKLDKLYELYKEE